MKALNIDKNTKSQQLESMIKNLPVNHRKALVKRMSCEMKWSIQAYRGLNNFAGVKSKQELIAWKLTLPALLWIIFKRHEKKDIFVQCNTSIKINALSYIFVSKYGFLRNNTSFLSAFWRIVQLNAFNCFLKLPESRKFWLCSAIIWMIFFKYPEHILSQTNYGHFILYFEQTSKQIKQFKRQIKTNYWPIFSFKSKLHLP